VGAQGGDLLASLRAGLNCKGTGVLVPVSRGISRASNPSDAAKQFRDQINDVRKQIASENDNDNSNKKPKITDNNDGASATIQPYQRDFLNFALREGVLKFGSFVLKSGRTSPYFFNAGLFSTGQALFKLGKAYASTIMSSSSASGL